MPDIFYQKNIGDWALQLCAGRPDIEMDMAEDFLNKMYRSNPDIVFTVSRDFACGCQTPILVLPDDIPAHLYEVAIESALLAPNAQVSLYPWKDPEERIALAVRHIDSFLWAHKI